MSYPSENSRVLEMVDAIIARTGTSATEKISPETTPLDIRLMIAAVFSVKFALYGRMHPRPVYEDMREDLSYLLVAGFGQEALNSPAFKSAYDAVGKDIIDAMRAKGGF